MHYYDINHNAMGIFVTVNMNSFGTKYYANLGIMSCQVLFLSSAPYIKIRRITKEYRSKCIFLRASRWSRSASIPVHVEVLNGLTGNNNSQ